MRPQGAWLLAEALLSCSLMACAGAAGGAGGGAGSVSPAVVQSAAFEQCPWRWGEAVLQVAGSRAAWERLLSQGKSSLSPVSHWVPRFEDQWIVVYGAGLKRSSGHSLHMGAPVLTQGRRVLQVPVTQVSPPVGTLQAMVMTSPCVVGLIQTPPVDRLQVIDAHSRAVLAEQAPTR